MNPWLEFVVRHPVLMGCCFLYLMACLHQLVSWVLCQRD